MENTATETKNDFKQLCVWPGTLVGADADSIKKFEEFMGITFNGIRIKYEAEVKTFPDSINGKVVPRTGGRNDLFFWIHNEDVPKFAVPRLQYGIRWWEDVLNNEGGRLYPEEFLKSHPKTW